MSLLFYENQLRFQPNSESETQQSISTSSSSTTIQSPASFDLSSYSKKLKPTSQHQTKTSPKIPSNLVKSQPEANEALTTSLLNYEKDQLVQFVSEKEKILCTARNEYDQQYENFFKLTKKFQVEKLNNLKLTFKNQMLKQKIYFETELAEMSKECQRDFEKYFKMDSKCQTVQKPAKSDKDKEKHLIRAFKQDMKKLLDYMREALVTSGDTLIEAYEACQVLKSLEKIENNLHKQNVNMKNSTSSLINNKHMDLECENSQAKKLHKQLNDDELRFNKYKFEMDELIHILDDIELQHLQRKDQLTTRTKFFNKLKSKFKFIENKYEVLNKQCLNLKLESAVYKQLWEEKQRTHTPPPSPVIKEDECSCVLVQSNQKINLSSDSEDFNFCCKCSTSSSLSPSRSSRSSSLSSLSDDNQLDEHLELEDDMASVSSSSEESASTSSSTSLLSSSHEYYVEEEFDEPRNRNPAAYLSTHDYNRKLDIVKNLISLHVSKSAYSKDPSATSSSNLLSINNLWRHTQTIDSFNFNSEINNVLTHASASNIRHGGCRETSSLDLSNCSLDGERVVIENSNLKADFDLSEWCLTRQIEPNMCVSEFKLPHGSVIKSGKALRIHAPFQSSPVDFLLAIKQHNSTTRNSCSTASKKNKLSLKIITKLVSPDGSIKAIHYQEIPQFYQEIFKYANLIRLV